MEETSRLVTPTIIISTENRNSSTFELLPEIWEKIFSYLTPSEFLFAINSFPNWRELAKSKIPTALLPLVLPILVDNLQSSNKEILIWRRLSRHARNTFDQIISENSTSSEKYYQNHTTKYWSTKLKAKELKNRVRLIENIKSHYKFRTLDEYQTFLKVFEMKSTSLRETPIITRNLHLELKTAGELPENPELIAERLVLLSRFGSNIVELTLSFPGNIYGENLSHLVTMLLSRVPNLKILQLCNSQETTEMDETIRLFSNIEFPQLEYLELLNVEQCNEDWEAENKKYSLIRLLLKRYGHQLKILICAENLFQMADQPELKTQLENLRILRLRSVDKSTIDILAQLPLKLEEIQVCDFNLRDHGSIPVIQITPEFVKAETFFEMLNNFSDTLQHLQINFAIRNTQFVGDFMRLLFESGTFKECSKLEKLTAAFVNVGISWFWFCIKNKFPNIKELELYTTAKITKKKEHYAKDGFKALPKLKEIRMWCSRPAHGEKNVRIIRMKNESYSDESKKVIPVKNAVKCVKL